MSDIIIVQGQQVWREELLAFWFRFLQNYILIINQNKVLSLCER